MQRGVNESRTTSSGNIDPEDDIEHRGHATGVGESPLNRVVTNSGRGPRQGTGGHVGNGHGWVTGRSLGGQRRLSQRREVNGQRISLGREAWHVEWVGVDVHVDVDEVSRNCRGHRTLGLSRVQTCDHRGRVITEKEDQKKEMMTQMTDLLLSSRLLTRQHMVN